MDIHSRWCGMPTGSQPERQNNRRLLNMDKKKTLGRTGWLDNWPLSGGRTEEVVGGECRSCSVDKVISFPPHPRCLPPCIPPRVKWTNRMHSVVCYPLVAGGEGELGKCAECLFMQSKRIFRPRVFIGVYREETQNTLAMLESASVSFFIFPSRLSFRFPNLFPSFPFVFLTFTNLFLPSLFPFSKWFQFLSIYPFENVFSFPYLIFLFSTSFLC